MKIITSIILLALLVSCGNTEVKEKPKETLPKQENKWNILEIEVDDQRMMITREQDTCFYREKLDDEEYRKAHNGEYKTKEIRFPISQKMRDSIFKLAEDAIIHFVPSNEFVTCYAGQNVTISLDNSISCHYSSIPDWTKVSKTLFKLDQLTFKEVKRQNK